MDGIEIGLIKCKGCNTVFEKRANKRWCSGKCYARAKRLRRAKKRNPKNCTECGQLFTPIRENNVRCSKTCQAIWQKRYIKEKCRISREKRRKNRKPIQCKNCQKEFIPSNIIKKYCSMECRKLFRRDRRIIKPLKLMWGVPSLREIEEKDINNSAFANEIIAYKESGKKIIVLPSSPDINIEDEQIIDEETIIINKFNPEKKI